MSDFEQAFSFMIPHEGERCSINPNDPGGKTCFGISQKFCNTEGIEMPETLEGAKEIYRHYFWQRNNYGDILDQLLADKIFDLSVNMGSSTVIKFVQNGCSIKADGICGPHTIEAINKSDSLDLLNYIKMVASLRYKELVSKNPKLNIFLKGWLNRVAE